MGRNINSNKHRDILSGRLEPLRKSETIFRQKAALPSSGPAAVDRGSSFRGDRRSPRSAVELGALRSALPLAVELLCSLFFSTHCGPLSR